MAGRVTFALLLCILCATQVFAIFQTSIPNTFFIFNTGEDDQPLPTFDGLSFPYDLSPYAASGFTIEFFGAAFGLSYAFYYQPWIGIGNVTDGIFVSPYGVGIGAPSVQPAILVRSGGVNTFEYKFPSTYGAQEWLHFTLGYRSGAECYLRLSSRKYLATVVTAESTVLFNASLDASLLANGFKSMAMPGQPTASLPFSVSGYVDEVKIWNSYRSPAVTAPLRNTVLYGDEPGLLGYHRFTGGALTSTAPQGVTAVLNNGGGSGQSISIVGTGRLVPLLDFNRVVALGAKTGDILDSSILPQPVITLLSVSPAVGRFCDGDTTSLVCLNVSRTTSYNFSYVADRSACGQNVTLAIAAVLASSPTTYDDVLTYHIRVAGITPSLTVRNYTLPTTGGALEIDGTNLGLDTPLALNFGESVSFTIRGNSQPCPNPRVINNGNTLVCDIPAGFGKDGRISVSLCNNIALNNQPFFSYDPPVIDSAFLTTDSSGSNTTAKVAIVGSNFGPGRTWSEDANTDIISINGTTCTVSFVNDTYILCDTVTDLNDNLTYIMTLTIGGQTVEYGFNYVLCSRPCFNGGTCIGYNKCDCKNTGFEGSQCRDPLICSPPCVNDAKCVRSSSNNSLLVCDCGGLYTGDDCSLPIPGPPGLISGSSNLALAIGLGAGGGGLALILGVGAFIGWFMFYRQKKRGTKNFIPLEKKDFTKIIYGDQLNSEPEKHSGDLSQLEQLLLANDLKLATAISNITQITEADKIAKAMVIVFHDNNKALTLLQQFIDEEVKTTESAGTLFRSNSMVSKMFKFYSRLLGLPYLYVTIGPEIDELIGAQLGLEVDPEKMTEGTDLDEMRWMLMAQSQKILKQVLNSWDECPTQFRSLFAHLKHVVAQRFADNVNTTIGGFIFLRFFCPAVSSPEAYGILEEPPSPEARRLLILITKVLQNLSNDVEFGSKEPYMAKMNDFIQSNRVKLAQFYEKLVKPTNKPNTEVVLPKNMKTIQLAVLSNHIRQNIEQIEDQELRKKLDTIV